MESQPLQNLGLKEVKGIQGVFFQSLLSMLHRKSRPSKPLMVRGGGSSCFYQLHGSKWLELFWRLIGRICQTKNRRPTTNVDCDCDGKDWRNLSVVLSCCRGCCLMYHHTRRNIMRQQWWLMSEGPLSDDQQQSTTPASPLSVRMMQ